MGTLCTSRIYDSPINRFTQGTRTVTYSIEPDTATTALVRMIATERDTFGQVTSTTTLLLQINTNGGHRWISEQEVDPVNNAQLLLTYQ